MAYKIFIDLMHQDEKLGKELSKKLERAGAEVLPLENSDDKDFKIKLKSGLRQADEVILFLTPNSLDSQKLFYDMGVAAALKKPVTTVLHGVETKDLPRLVNETIYIKYSEIGQYLSKLREKASAPEGESEKIKVDRMKKALRSEKFTWRSIKTLADVGGVLESEALNILRNDPDVVLGSGKSGARLAKLKDR
ncbi:MAG TPA: TIR domain-containing protein [Pyrinomonadaceae bacterium]|nr:TIR domain-containing protein [Pyrinomonadaceae bacterium]